MPTSLLRAGPLAADFVGGVNRPTFAVRNNHRVAVFPAGVVTETFYTLNMPTVFASGDITVKLIWMSSVTSGSAVWEVSFERHQIGTGDLDSDSFAIGQILVSAADAVSGVPIEAIIPFVAGEYDGLLPGEEFRIRVRRLGDESSDNMAGLAQLKTIVIDQTADPAGGSGFFSDGAGTRAGIGAGSPAPTAAGLEALSHGSSAEATGDESLALLSGAKMLGDRGITLGKNSGHASSIEADRINLGYYANAEGIKGIAIGPYAHTAATMTSGIAIGDHANIEFAFGIAIGSYGRSESPDHIHIGRDFTPTSISTSNDLITIGRDHSNPNIRALRGIVIGHKIKIGEDDNILIGQKLNCEGPNNIIIGRYLGGGVNQDPQKLYANICFDTANNYLSGLDNSGTISAYIDQSIVLNAGGGQGGIRTWDGNNQAENIVLSAISTFMYGNCARNIIIGSRCEMGDFGNQLFYSSGNICMGDQNYIFTYGNNTAPTTEANVILGKSLTMGPHVSSCFLQGDNCSIFGNYDYTKSVIVMGKDSYGGPGMCNVILGNYSSCYYGGAFSSSNYFRGNFVQGYQCSSDPLADAPWRSTIAQGVGTKAWVSGHRAFSAGDMSDGFSGGQGKPNQGGWVVNHVETIDATQTVVLTFPTESDKAYTLWGHAIARRTDVDGENEAFSLSGQLIYRNATGGPTLVGAPVSWTSDKNQGTPAWLIDATISSNDLVIRVTGTGGKTVEWLVWLNIIEVRG